MRRSSSPRGWLGCHRRLFGGKGGDTDDGSFEFTCRRLIRGSSRSRMTTCPVGHDEPVAHPKTSPPPRSAGGPLRARPVVGLVADVLAPFPGVRFRPATSHARRVHSARSRLHTTRDSSPHVVANSLLSGENATSNAMRAAPAVSVEPVPFGLSNSPRRCWVPTSHTMTPSSVVTASMRPSGLNTMLGLDPPWPTSGAPTGVRRSTSMMSTRPSPNPAAMSLPSALKSTPRIGPFPSARAVTLPSPSVLQHDASVAPAARREPAVGAQRDDDGAVGDVQLRPAPDRPVARRRRA